MVKKEVCMCGSYIGDACSTGGCVSMKEYYRDEAEDEMEEAFECGCKYISKHSSAIQLCEECSKLPCHNR